MQEVFEKYLELFPEDKLHLGLLRRQFDGTEKLNDRSNFTGHITGGAIVLSPDRKRILLIHHKSSPGNPPVRLVRLAKV